jgi:hypothetical protein
MKNLFLILFLTLSSFASAYDVEAWGRSYDYSCGYFSRRAADVSLTYHNNNLPYGTEVNVIVGYKGSNAGGGVNNYFDWADKVTIPAKAIDSGSWEARITDKTLHHRTEGRFLESAQFVFEVKAPGHAVEYVNSGGAWGYFETENLNAMVGCVSNGQLPNYRRLTVRSVQKN